MVAKRGQAGFTLIELLVVIAIIAILAAIAIPAFNKYRDNAQQKAAMANARTCLTQMAAVLAEKPNATQADFDAAKPAHCTTASATSCTCNSPDGTKTVTCSYNDAGTVTCQ